MKVAGRKHKRSYSSIYKIYRRVRFIRYKKKLAKRSRKELLQRERLEKEEVRQKLAEYRKNEVEQYRLKVKADKEEQKRNKEDLSREFRERELLAREEFKKHSKADLEKLKEQQLIERQESNRKLQEERALRKQNFKQVIHSFSLSTIRSNFREFRENAPRRKVAWVITLNSTVLFLLSYFTLYLIYQAVTVIAGSLFDYPVILYYYEVYFNISPEKWYNDSVKTIFSAGPLILFILAIISFIIYSNLKELTGNFKIFFLWSFLHGTNMLFGALLVGTLFDTGVGYVISWMYIMDTGKVLYSTISIFMLVIAGLISVKPFLFSGNHYFNFLSKENRTFLIKFQVIMPFLAGNVIIFLIRYPHFMFYETFTCLVMIISMLGIVFTYHNFHELYFDEDEKMIRFDWLFLFFLLGIILFYRGILQLGIRLGG